MHFLPIFGDFCLLDLDHLCGSGSTSLPDIRLNIRYPAAKKAGLFLTWAYRYCKACCSSYLSSMPGVRLNTFSFQAAFRGGLAGSWATNLIFEKEPAYKNTNYIYRNCKNSTSTVPTKNGRIGNWTRCKNVKLKTIVLRILLQNLA